MALPKRPLRSSNENPANDDVVSQEFEGDVPLATSPENEFLDLTPEIVGLDLDEASTKEDAHYNVPSRRVAIVQEKKDSGPSVLEQAYKKMGEITVDQAINEPYEYYAHLGEGIINTVQYIQDLLTEQGRSEQVGKARRERGSKLFKEMSAEIDRLVLRRINNGDYAVAPQDVKYFLAAVNNEILGFGPLEPLWGSSLISEVIVNGPHEVYVEMKGQLTLAKGVKFQSAEHLLIICQQMLGLVGRRVDVAMPYADGTLPDGSRFNVIHQVIAPHGPLLTIRRFPDTAFSLKKLVEVGSMNEDMAEIVGNLVHHGVSIVIVGGTGSGKAVSLETKLPTPTGMTTMGEVKVGDKVLDESGNPCNVTAYYPQPLNPCYELTFSDGTKITADENHNWFTSTRSSRRAVSRQERSDKHINAKRTKFATNEELEILVSLAAEAGRWTNPAMIIARLPRLRTMIYNATKTLDKAPESKAKFALYDSVDFFTEVIRRANNTRDQRHKSNVESVVTTKEIFETLRTPTGHANHAVRMIPSAVQYAEQNLPVTPYAFGAWLGDGYTGNGEICGIDDEIFETIINEGNEISSDRNGIVPPGKKPIRLVKFSGMTNALRTLALADKNEKFIPDVYLYSSEAQRRALIAGMLDTDGTVSKSKGTVEFANSNKNLIDGFRQIVHSLGYQSTVTSKIPTFTHKGEKKKGKRAYIVSFYTQDDVFFLPRKQEIHESVRNSKMAGHRSEYRYIVDCQPVESVPTACITVDSPNHLYLATDAFITTHNTSALNALSGCIPNGDRVITIEDTVELRLNKKKHVASMQSRPASPKGEGAVTIRDLVRNSLRMRPDRVIVGEVRDASAYDMMQAMNTGHEGSLTTVHANDASGAVERISLLVSEAGEITPERALSLIAGGVDAFLVIKRYEDGSRRVKGLYEVPSTLVSKGNKLYLEPIPLWEFVQDSSDTDEKVEGHYEEMNKMSESLIRKHSLDKRKHLTLDDLYDLSDVPLEQEVIPTITIKTD